MTGGLPPSLTPGQIAQIIRDRRAGLQYKQIAIRVGCTPDQAIYYWRISTAYKPEAKRSLSAKQREAKKLTAYQARRRREIAAARTALAAAMMQREVQGAREQLIHAPAQAYKPGPLEW